MKKLLPWLKFLGIVLFLWILLKIDRNLLFGYIRHANQTMLLLSLPVLFCMYLIKTVRWHILVKSTGAHPTFKGSWELYNIGVFLAAITPGKLGEFGRAAYLRDSASRLA